MGTEGQLSVVAGEVRGCLLCALARGRTQAVPGEGNPLSDVLFVGEGPGGREDATGRPFVGPAGQLLTELLRAIGWDLLGGATSLDPARAAPQEGVRPARRADSSAARC